MLNLVWFTVMNYLVHYMVCSVYVPLLKTMPVSYTHLIRYGADAVYCAGKRFGLRAGNSNFSDEELKEAVEFVHAHGKKIHVTCNIIPHNEDLSLIHI